MTRVLELIVALVIVAVLGVVVGVAMPSSGHVERSLVIGKDLRQVYDVLNNYRRLPEYSVLRVYDPQLRYSLAGKAYGPGAEVSWASDDAKVGNGKLTIAAADPSFDKVAGTTNKGSIVWDLRNDWRGENKRFTLALERNGRAGKLTKLTWSYDVDYGFNLIDRFSNLYIHGDPDAFIQFSLNNLQNVLAAVPNIDYSPIVPGIERTKPTPVLSLAASSQRKDGLAALDETIAKSVGTLQAAAKKLDVHVSGPRIVFTTNYGDQNYSFDVAVPIDAANLTVAGQAHPLASMSVPKLDASAPATAGTAEAPAETAPAPGGTDRFNRLVLDGGVRAYLAFGGAALRAEWTGTGAGVRQTRDMLKAYAQTHGYKYDEVVNRQYDILIKPEVKNGDEVRSYETYVVYLPITDAPEQTPEQAAGIKPKMGDDTAPAADSSAAGSAQ